MHDDYDRGSKWLIQHRGDAILRLGGVRNIRAWRSLQSEVVQPKQMPDGVLEVEVEGQTEPDLYVIEIATYPESRNPEQLLRDTAMVYLARRVLPEVMVLVLRPKGKKRVVSTQKLTSRQGWTHWQASVRVVELWKVLAEELLATNDVGLVPWVPLTNFEGPPEAILQKCRERIDELAPPEEKVNFLAVSQIMTKLRYR